MVGTRRTVVLAGAALMTGTALAGCSAPTAEVSAASCAAVSASRYLAAAHVVFVGTALTGPTVSSGSAVAVLASPARFHVDRYLKGTGPALVSVVTGITARGDGVAVAEDGIQPRTGEKWRIYATTAHAPYETSICGGSCLMSGNDGTSLTCSAIDARK